MATYINGVATFIDTHIRRCTSLSNVGGLWPIGASRMTMIRGAITECTAPAFGGAACVEPGNSLTLIDVLVDRCKTFSSGGDARGGGILVMGATDVMSGILVMSGGAFRECESLNSQGGGLAVVAGQAQLNGVAFFGCKAMEGAGVFSSDGDLLLSDVSIESCNASSYGALVYSGAGSKLRAERVRVANCHAVLAHGGVLCNGGSSTSVLQLEPHATSA